MKSMKKHFLSLLTLFLPLFSVGFGSWSIEAREAATSKEMKVSSSTRAPVAYIGNTYFATLDKALEQASGNTTADKIYVIPGTNPSITKNATVKKGDELLLPTSGTTTIVRKEAENDDFSDTSDASIKTYRKNQISLAKGVVLTLEGVLEIGGSIGVSTSRSHQRPTGHTGGDYCEILMAENSRIDCVGEGAKIDCGGYIKEDTNGNGSSVNIKEKGQLYLPMVVYDYGGGGDVSGKTGKNLFPFCVYDFPNIRPQINCYSSAKVECYMDMYVKLSGHNVVEFNLVNSTGALFNLQEGSFVSLKYNPKDPKYTRYADQKQGATNITFHGNVNADALTFDVAGDSLETAKMMFPYSYKFNVVIADGSTTFNAKVKIMSGCRFTVNPGASLTFNQNTIIYDKYIRNSVDDSNLPKNLGAGRLFVNGTLNLNAAFGGLIETSSDTGAIHTGDQFENNIYSLEGYKSGQSNPFTETGTLQGEAKIYLEKHAEENKTILEKRSYISKGSSEGNSYWLNSEPCIHLSTKQFDAGTYATPTYSVFISTDNGATFTEKSGSPTSVPCQIGTQYYIQFQDNITGYINAKGSEIQVSSLPAKSETYTIEDYRDVNIVILPTKISDETPTLTSVTISADKLETGPGENGSFILTATKYEPSNAIVKSYLWSCAQGGSFDHPDRQTTLLSVPAAGDNDVKYTVTCTLTDSTGKSVQSEPLTITAKKKDSCIEIGSLITMADGTTQKVEELRIGDNVRTWDFETGSYASRPIILIEKQLTYTKVTTIHFDDGTSLNIIGEQTFFDVDKKDYVVLDSSNIDSYRGTRIMAGGSSVSIKTIVDSSSIMKATTAYELITAFDYNFFANGTMTLTPLAPSHTFFDVNDSYQYDPSAKANDISTYGLYTYDDFRDELSESQFVATNCAYWKVAVGKGYVTEEYVHEVITLFKSFDHSD